MGAVDSGSIGTFIKACSSPDACDTYEWIRQYPGILTSCCSLKKTDFADVIEAIDIDTRGRSGVAIRPTPPEIPITVLCRSPLAHGADTKAGNCTLFRRMHVLSTTGDTLVLPFYAGNAIRGQLRDLLADDFLRRLGLTPRRDTPPVALWFFHALYAGGALEEGSAAEKGLGKILGKNGAARAEGFYRVRNTLPVLSLMGVALGNRILNGRFQSMDLRPRCREWDTGEIPVGELFEWQFLTRRDDHEGHEEGENASMIANTECLKAGVTLDGGMDTDANITDIERSALGHGIQLLANRAKLGAEIRRGFGDVEISSDNAPSPDLYKLFMEEKRGEVLEFLVEIGAITAEVAVDTQG